MGSQVGDAALQHVARSKEPIFAEADARGVPVAKRSPGSSFMCLEKYPNITLSILVSSHEEFEPALIDDKLDLGIGFGDLPSDDIEVIPLHEERLALIVNAKRPAARKAAMSAADVASTPTAALDPTFSIRRAIDRYFREQGLRPQIAVEANSVSALIELVRLTDLATILPENVGGAGLTTVKMKPAFEIRRAALLRRRNAYCSAVAKAFIATVQDISEEFAEA